MGANLFDSRYLYPELEITLEFLWALRCRECW